MLAARVLVGVGEAAYGSVGIAVIISVFPKHMRATLTGAFMAGGLAGQVLGVGIGGARRGRAWLAHGLPARSALAACCSPLAYPLVRARIAPERRRAARNGPVVTLGEPPLAVRRTQLSSAPMSAAACQLFVGGALPAWLPTYFIRYYDLPLDKAASLAALFLAIGGAGMIVCGMISDRLVRDAEPARDAVRLGYCLACAVLIARGVQPRPRHAAARSSRAGNVPCRRNAQDRPARWSRT